MVEISPPCHPFNQSGGLESLRTQVESEHEYLRKHVDPVIMPLIESLLLYQPTNPYDFLPKLINKQPLGPAIYSHLRAHRKNKKLSERRSQMANYMAKNVLPLMEHITSQIVTERPENVTDYIVKEVDKLNVSSNNQLEEEGNCDTVSHNHEISMCFQVGDLVECRYKGRPKFLPAVITESNLTTSKYTVQYTDGKVEENVHAVCIRYVNNQLEQSLKKNLADIKSVILLIGLDNSGKSTLLSSLQGDTETQHTPSVGYSSVSFQLSNGSTTFYDLGGGPTIRDVWKEYFSDAHGIIWVVDSSDDKRLKESAELMMSSMTDTYLKDKPILIFGNKMDKIGHSTSEEVKHLFSGITRSNYIPCIARPKSNENIVDPSLEVGLTWLFQEIEDQYESLDLRVQNDLVHKKKIYDEKKKQQKLRVQAWKEERERNRMLDEDKQEYKAENSKVGEDKKTNTDENVVLCSSCNSEPASTKCSASKWMPVCGTCAVKLKQQNN